MVSGGMVSGLALAIASLMGPQPAGNTPPAAPQTSVDDAAVDPSVSAPAETSVAVDTAPGGEGPAIVVAPETGDSAISVDTQPAAVPQTGAEPGQPDGAASGGDQPDITGEAPVLPSPQTAGPQAPEGEADVSISTDPTQPIAPAAEDEETFIVVDQDALIPLDPQVGEPTEEAAPSTDGTSRLNDAVPVRRTGAATDEAVEEAPKLPAITEFAVPFQADGRPLLSIVMIDSDQFGLAPKALSDLGMNVTFAVRASMPDVAERAKAYRAMGHEVALLSDLPTGAQATDAAVTLEASFDLIPEAVALIDAGTGGLGSDRDVIGVSLDRLADDGRGLVVLDGGLNTAKRMAGAAEIPNVAISRDLDGQKQSAQIIRRFLDQAAFRARQDGAVTVLTRLRPETLSALQLWSAATRAEEVQLAPLTALLTRED